MWQVMRNITKLKCSCLCSFITTNLLIRFLHSRKFDSFWIPYDRYYAEYTLTTAKDQFSEHDTKNVELHEDGSEGFPEIDNILPIMPHECTSPIKIICKFHYIFSMLNIFVIFHHYMHHCDISTCRAWWGHATDSAGFWK